MLRAVGGEIMSRKTMIVSAIILLLLTMLFNAFVIAQLWQWFVVSVFDAPSLSIPVVLGLYALIDLIRRKPNESVPEGLTDDEYLTLFSKALANLLGRPLIALVWGFILFQFVGKVTP